MSSSRVIHLRVLRVLRFHFSYLPAQDCQFVAQSACADWAAGRSAGVGGVRGKLSRLIRRVLWRMCLTARKMEPQITQITQRARCPTGPGLRAMNVIVPRHPFACFACFAVPFFLLAGTRLPIRCHGPRRGRRNALQASTPCPPSAPCNCWPTATSR